MDEPACPGCRELTKRVAELEALVAELEALVAELEALVAELTRKLEELSAPASVRPRPSAKVRPKPIRKCPAARPANNTVSTAIGRHRHPT